MPASQPEAIPHAPGIYEIRCNANGKIYIGSAVDLHHRWLAHRRDLRHGCHHNPYLQHAWNHRGERRFSFRVLEFVPIAFLLHREQWWIVETRCTDRSVGFNIKTEATSAGAGIGRHWVGFHDPQGRPIEIVNLAAFCRRTGLCASSMIRLSKGVSKLKSYKGWTHVNSVRKREFIKTHRGFIEPTGQRALPIRNLAAFCKRFGLDPTHMIAVAKGRIVSHKGWTHVDGRRRLPPKEYRGFIAPDGTRSTITNLSAFCRAHNLCVVHMHEVKSGKRPRHKGWTWNEDGDQTPK